MNNNRTLSPRAVNATNQHYNDTDEINEDFLIFYSCVLLSISVAVIVGNVVVIVTLLKNKQLKQPSNYFIVSLSLSDLLFGIFFPAYNAGQWSESAYTKFLAARGPCVTLLIVVTWLEMNSAYHLVALTLTRYIAITRPLLYNNLVTHRRCLSGVAVTWITALCLAISMYSTSSCQGYPKLVSLFQLFSSGYLGIGLYVPSTPKVIYGRGKLRKKETPGLYVRSTAKVIYGREKLRKKEKPGFFPSNVCKFELVFEENRSYMLAICTVVVPVSCMIGLYSVIIHIARRQIRCIRQSSENEARKGRHRIFFREMRSTMIVCFLVGYFAFAWVPLAFYIIYSAVCQCHTSKYISLCTRLLVYTNYSVNVFVYAGRLKNFRRYALNNLKCLSDCATLDTGHTNRQKETRF